jgi:aryl-alcohol dehydrogenase-like predicted oxidoreductase
VDRARGGVVIGAMRKITEAKGCSVTQVALAWLLHQEAVTSVIVGANRVQQLHDNIHATEVRLDAEHLTALDAVSKLPAEYPGRMLQRQGAYRT